VTQPPLVGHDRVRARLRAAIADGRLPQALLLHGPAGVGKQRLALWIAQALQCEGPERPCGDCRSCRLAGELSHPDIHWFFPLPKPAGSLDKKRLRQKLEEARNEELGIRRDAPLRPVGNDPAAKGLYLAMVAEIRERASRRPAMGPYAAFIVGDADRLVPQAANPEAANALLKLLEEPPPDCFFVLTTCRPAALLPTIRSRVASLRIGPLTEAEVAGFLCRHGGVEATRAAEIARLCEGSPGRGLARMLEAGDGETADRAEAFLRAALVPNPGDRLRLAATLPNRGARGEFTRVLEELQLRLRDRLSVAVGAGSDVLPFMRAIEHTERAVSAASGNGNPQVIGAVLMTDLARELASRPVSGSGRLRG